MAQQAMIMETIMAMKKAIGRRDDASESDNSITGPTNRGNKLKRKSKNVRQGQLNLPIKKRRIEFNGYTRYIISQKPPRIDADGDIIEDEDETNSELSPAEEDPYADIRIEDILMPLTSAADLDKHPSFSLPYKSKALQEIEQHVQETLHREQATLWQIKNLHTHFRGDETWLPCGIMETDHDASFLSLHGVLPSTAPSDILDKESHITEDPPHDAYEQPSAFTEPNLDALANGADIEMANNHVEPTSNGAAHNPQINGHPESSEKTVPKIEEDVDAVNDSSQINAELGEDISSKTGINANGVNPETEASKLLEDASNSVENGEISTQAVNGEQTDKGDHVTVDEGTEEIAQNESETSERPPHRMTTRARAQANDTNSNTAGSRSRSSSRATSPIPIVHPFFIAPPTAFPHTLVRGLTVPVAQETRRLLNVYVQKQEEVVRQYAELLASLQKALRLRQMVWRWCRAEGHVGEMSDGEDWIDEEEWGLDGPLKKGEEVEDDEVYATAGKKTRNRRAVA